MVPGRTPRSEGVRWVVRDDADGIGADAASCTVMEPLYAPVTASIEALFASMDWRVNVHGVHNLPAEGPGVLAVNHISYLDPLVVVAVAHRRARYVRFLGKQEVFRSRLIGPLLRQMQHVPVHRGSDRGRALTAAAELLHAGELVCLYPEATISTSFVPMSLKPGAAQLALRTDAPLIPIATFGAHRISTKHRHRRYRRDVTFSVAVGTPVDTDGDEAAVTDRLGRRLRRMVDDLVATYPQLPTDPSQCWWVPEHLGGAAPTVEQAEELRRHEHERRMRTAGSPPPGDAA